MSRRVFLPPTGPAAAGRVLRALVVLAPLLLAPVQAAAATVGDPVAARAAEARQHYEAGRFEPALRAYRDALVQRPEAPGLHLNVGDALYQLEQYEEALQEFERAAAAADPELAAQGLYNKGNAHYQMQDFQAAADAYRQALERAPEDADAKANLELALRQLQPPPPQPQSGQGDESEDGQQDQNQQQQQQQDEQQGQPPQDQQQQGEPPPSPEAEDTPPEPDSQQAPPESGQEGEEPKEPQEAPPERGEPGEEGMDEDEARRLLEALEDRDAEAQKRRYRASGRDAAEDW